MARLRLFGHPALESNESSRPLGLPSKAVCVIALAATSADRPMPRDWLAQTVWPDTDPSEARANLRRQIHRALKALGDDVFVLTRQTLQWNAAGSLDCDVVKFDALRTADAAGAVEQYGGELCAGVAEECLEDVRVRYRSRYEHLLRTLIENARDAENTVQMRLWLHRLIAHDPLDEEAVREIMSLRVSMGDRPGAIRDYNALSQRLHAQLGVEPQPQTVSLFTQIVGEYPAPVTPHNVGNSTTTFVGRERELRAIQEGLRNSRIVVLLGTGGIGKSRLATRSCLDLLPSYPSGVWFADLQHCASEDDVWLQIASAARLAAGESPQAAVLQHFADVEALIALDTCEHVLQAARTVAEKLLAHTKAHVLATSRHRLGITAGCEIDVGPLDLPPASLAEGDSPLRYAAYRLFVERAASVSPAFHAAASNVRHLIELLHNIDGLPLAIELVASRANALSINSMRRRFREALRAASEHTGRNRTMDAALAWSYALLTPDQQQLFAAVGVFNGKFTVEDVEQVCRHIADPVPRLFELIDASLVSVVRTDEEPRYRLLETTRNFALEKLAPVFSSVVESHAEHFAGKADALAAMPETDFAKFIGSLSDALPDFLAALEHATARGWGSIGVRLVEGLYRFAMRGHFTVPVRERAKAFAANAQIPEAQRAVVARLAAILEENTASLPLYEFAASYYRKSGDDVRLCETLSGLAATHFIMGNYDECERLLLYVRDKMEHGGDRRVYLKALGRLGTLYTTHNGEQRYDEALEIMPMVASELQELGEVRQAAQHLKNLAASAYFVRRYEDALTWAQKALELTALTSEVAMRLNLLTLCGAAEQERGNLRAAAEWHLQACELVDTLGESREAAESLQDIAGALCALGNLTEAARVAGYSERLRAKLAFPLNPAERSDYDRMLARLEAGLGANLAEAWAGFASDTLADVTAVARQSLKSAT